MVLYSAMKILIFSFNCITFMGGTALFGMGVWIKVDAGYVFVILWNISVPLRVVENVSYLCILIGSLLIIIGFLACYGARKENKYMLLTFFLIMLVIFLAQLVAGMTFMLFSSLSEVLMDHIQNWFQKFIKNDYGRDKEITDTFDSLMQKFRCCGIMGYIDFENSYFTNTTNTYPGSCCFSSGPCIIPHRVQSCNNLLRNFLWKNLTLFGMFALGTALFEIGAMATSMIMYCQVRKKLIKT
ncbi:tetraspanin-1-like [Hypanus sabinus]|uniref:tetraspanin-1-like n=1 Tax=Hypanus sabinus TaxID=79690 RepID=UPI0028C4E4A8|nr:tetraspanin-1-like [Hypanus sabinus]